MRGNTLCHMHFLRNSFLFQFTPLHERQLFQRLIVRRFFGFQFTPLHERQPEQISKLFLVWLFQFTPLHERQHNKIARKVEYQYFNSRLYMRGSHWCRQVSCCRLYFNSRLYMRGSCCAGCSASQHHISIHAST